MYKYINTVTDYSGNRVAGAVATVTTIDGNPAALYSDANGTTQIGYQVTTNSRGQFSFYAESGRYNILVSSPSIVSYSLDDVYIGYNKFESLNVGLPATMLGMDKGGVLIGAGSEVSINGALLSLDGASNWASIQTTKNENPTEFIVYNSAAQGYAETVSGTGNITRLWGSEFKVDWVGSTIYFLRKKFKVASFTSSSLITVTELDNSPVTFPITETEAYNYCYTSGSGICNVSGTIVTFVSGDPFVPLFFSDFSFKINGTLVTVSSFESATQYTLSASLGTLTNATFSWKGNINDQLSTFRVQSILGANEENVNFYSVAGDTLLGRYNAIRAGAGGTYAKYRPIYIGTGSYTDYTPQDQIGVIPPAVGVQGYVALGGVMGREGLRVYAPNASTPLANYLSIQGSATTIAPAIKTEGSDSNIGFGIDTKGTGNTTFTSHSFANKEFEIFGTGGSSYLAVTSSTTEAPTMSANGAASNIDIKLAPKGTGYIWLGGYTASGDVAVNGYVMVKDSSGVVRKLATVA